MDTDKRIVRHRLTEERAATLKSHQPHEIRARDRYDRILRRLLDGVNWADKNPAYCSRTWHTSTDLVLAALSDRITALGDAPAVLHIPISTYISGCRLHLGDRWPGLDIDRRPRRPGERGQYEYRISTRAEIEYRRAGTRSTTKSRATRGAPREGPDKRMAVGTSAAAPGRLFPQGAAESWPDLRRF